MRRMDDIGDTVTRAECVMSITLNALVRDIETCVEINDALAFDHDTIAAFVDQVDAIAALVSTLRFDMESHVKETGREWLKDADKATT